MEYHKIDSVFKRDPATNYKTFLKEWTRPEFEYLKDAAWYATEKVDGTNMRIYNVTEADPIRGRTDKAEIHKDLRAACEEIHKRMLDTDLPSDTVLYGEGYGAGIQKGGGQYRPDKGFILFDVLIDGRWQPRENVNGIADKLGIPHVPVLHTSDLLSWVRAIRDKLFMNSKLNVHALSEGVVLRPTVELMDYRSRRIITKVKFRDFPEGES